MEKLDFYNLIFQKSSTDQQGDCLGPFKDYLSTNVRGKRGLFFAQKTKVSTSSLRTNVLWSVNIVLPYFFLPFTIPWFPKSVHCHLFKIIHNMHHVLLLYITYANSKLWNYIALCKLDTATSCIRQSFSDFYGWI